MATKIQKLPHTLIKIGRESDSAFHDMAAGNLGGDNQPIAFDAG
ncbi:hypothetical protein [Starkeya sp. ORNL1]|nr:hypothetical protein [Starkeya sp. ORNL1]